MPKPKIATPCRICGGPYHAKGLCEKHYASEKNKRLYRANKAASHEKTRRWRAENPEKVKEINRRGHAKHREKRNAAALEYRQEHLETLRALSRAWSKANPDKWVVTNTRRRLAVEAAIRRSEFDDLVIGEAYRLARLRSKPTGVKWHVDHVVPINSPIVCGLHCATNIQLLTARENVSKGNRWWPDMP